MKLLKPSWVHHDEKPIFSVDVHQDCLKFATGGQGMDSGRVVIWNLLPVLSEKAELDDSVPKILCQMDNHLACVNSVRWSQSGQMLASGSDDKLVMIWRRSKGPSGVFGTGGIQKNPESWKCIATLRGHSGDVLDLAWSPQDRYLSSCSVDNSIIVWDAQAFPVIIAMLKGHTGLVKGVAWDPVGKFLASQSDDRSVKIWKTADWTCSNTITEPFEECGGTTHILRLSWSPDGQYLVSAHAMNSGGPTAQIIEREGWKCDKDFVGHRKAVTCVRFHTSILKRQAPRTNKPQQYCCLAVGSRDRSLSVWMTALQRPLVVIHELFNDSILDLSWGPEKCILMACSGDGSVACLQFSEMELGTPMSEEDKNILYQRIYGKTVTLENGSSGATDMIIENPDLLNVSQEKLKPPTLPVMPMTNHNNNLVDSTAVPTTTVQVNGFLESSGAHFHGVSSVTSNSSSGTPMKAINKQLETRTADGKRRITPVFIPLNQDCSMSTSRMCHSSRSAYADTTTVISEDPGAIELSDLLKSTESLLPAAKPVITEAEQTRLDSRLIKGTATSGTMMPIAANSAAIKNFSTIGSKVQTGPNVSPAAPHQASTTGPKLTITSNSKNEFQKTALDYRVHVHNGLVHTTMGLLAKVTAYSLRLGQKLWEVFIGSPIVNFNFCTKYVMLCSLDGTLRVLTMQTGSAKLPVISVPSMVLQCAFCPLGKLVGIFCEGGAVRIWDIEKECVFLSTTCTEIFGKLGTVVQFNITEHGAPLIMYTNGNSYTYSLRMQTWLVLNTKDPIMRHGLQTTIPKEFQKNFRLYPLTSVQASSGGFASPGTSMDPTASAWQSVAKITFIENQIKLCEAINSPEELKHWYTMLTYHLATNGTEKRLRLLLNDLLGPAHGIESYVLSIPKHTLLSNALNVLKTQTKWQRIYMEYNELYQDRNNFHSSDGDVDMKVA